MALLSRLALLAPIVTTVGAGFFACNISDPAEPSSPYVPGPIASLPDASVLSPCALVDGATCVRDLPTCPDGGPIPSYAATVKPIVQTHCAYCHYAGSTIAREDFTTQAGLQHELGTCIDQLYGCIMPPADAGVDFCAADKATLLQWLVCGAPDN